MLPIAYLIFYLLNNKESFLGDGLMKWPRREFFNILLVMALVVSVVGSIIQINNRVIKNEKVRAFMAEKLGWGTAPPPKLDPNTPDPTPPAPKKEEPAASPEAKVESEGEEQPPRRLRRKPK